MENPHEAEQAVLLERIVNNVVWSVRSLCLIADCQSGQGK